MKTIKILFAGGGTGGHIFPIIAIVRELRRILPSGTSAKFFYLGPRDPLAQILLSQEGIIVRSILAGKIRRYFTVWAFVQNIIDIFLKLPLGLILAFWYVFWLSPDLIFCKGGYGSFAVGLSGWLLASPIFIQESDVTPGLSNRILSRFASRIFVSFPETEYFPFQKMILVGQPIRQELLLGSRKEAEKLFKLKSGRPLLLILGGSQGARPLNDLILEILGQLLVDFEIIHQVGEKNVKDIELQVEALISRQLREYYHVFGFLKEEELKQALAASDLIICRAGSSTIFEIAAKAKPAILIPLPHAAQNHQVKNAYNYAKSGGAIVLEETNLSPHFFLEKIKYLLSQQELLQKMKKGALAFAKPEAAKLIAQEIISFLGLVNPN